MKTLFYGGKILTMDIPLYTDSVLVEDGKITAVGRREELTKQAPDTVIDLDGKTMLPAFIDAHSHFFQTAASLLQAPLLGVKSVKDMQIRIDDYIAANGVKPGDWIISRDFDPSLMPDGKNPPLSDLDRLAPHNPLVIHHKSGHMGLFNSEALRLLGAAESLKTAPWQGNGKIGTENGKLTGYMEENAFFYHLKKLPPQNSDDMLGAFERAQQKYLSYGIASIQEGMFTSQMLPFYKTLLKSKVLKTDITAYCEPSVYGTVKGELEGLNSRFHIGGMKIFLDGSPQGKTAWMRTPYIGDEKTGYRGYGTMTDNEVLTAMELSAKEGCQLLAHCNGDAAAEQFLNCLETAVEKYPIIRTLRPVIIHAQLIDADQLERAKRLSAMVSFFSAHVYYWGDVHIKNFSLERAAKISPAATALEHGVKFTMHQDAPVIEPDMIETIWCANSRITKTGQPLGRQERISVYNAVRAVTVNAAYQYSKENTHGTISAGKQADFTVLDRNPLQTPAQRMRDITVLQVYKDGECVFSKK